MRIQDTKIFCNEVPGDVLAQLNSVTCAWDVKQAALMPDAHLGYTVPIGSALSLEGMVSPHIIGFDIGCGVIAAPTGLFEDDIEEKGEEIWNSLKDTIRTKENENERVFGRSNDLTEIGQKIWKERGASFQLGTTGGGNHFIEIGCTAKSRRVWILIHTGSRGFGHGIASHYMNVSQYPQSIQCKTGQDYLTDYKVALDYAKRNRMILLMATKKALQDALGTDPQIRWDDKIDCVHNFVSFEDNLLIHRKGATSAKYGEPGIVVGNNVDGSYLVKGLGNKEALNSCSHGAGRRMSRGDAKKFLKIEEMKKDLETYRVYAGPMNKNSLAESADAYKDLDMVMDQQVGKLLKIEERIFPIVNFKG